MYRSLPLAVLLTLAAAGGLAAQSSASPAAPPKPAMQHDTTHAAKSTTRSTTPSMQHVANASHRASADDIRMAQQKLASLKLYSGKATGRSSRAFVAALKKYQHQNGLKVTGQLDDSTLAKLRATQ